MAENVSYFDEKIEALPLLQKNSQALIDDNDKTVSPIIENTQPTLFDEESPYEIVAINVSNQDDPTLPCLTFRSCILGLLFTCILSFVNQFFALRTRPIVLGMIVAQLLAYPMGKALALLLPSRTFIMFNGRWKFSLNPGPFSIKEHCIISTMASTAAIPPRVMFTTQIVATIVACVVHVWTAIYLINTVPHICTSKNIQWTCPIVTTVYSESIIWGAVGLKKVFGFQSIYWPLLFGFLIGALLPVPVWYLRMKYPKVKWLQYVHLPVILVGTSRIPPAPAGEYSAWFIVGFLFNFVIRRYAHAWWERYAFIFSAAMSCGVVVSALTIFFALTNNNIYFPAWWGTGGITGDGCPLASANFSGIIPHYKPSL
ncbi:unnamed protein product [Rotaria sp. Silwood1]|nr:unnamed protein product [Rotaria sp. Silwood1]